MSKYIDAEKLIAEIERLKERAQAERVLHPQTIFSAKNYLLIQDYDSLLSFITSLQQEQPEVELEKEISDTCRSYRIRGDFDGTELNKHDIENIARHFYELGLSAGKEE